jgi:hypothetical protein
VPYLSHCACVLKEVGRFVKGAFISEMLQENIIIAIIKGEKKPDHGFGQVLLRLIK